MEVHQPEKPIRSLSDFVFHIFTVTVGILIAIGLEALVEAHRNSDLVEHARLDFRTEFTLNRSKLIQDEPRLQRRASNPS